MPTQKTPNTILTVLLADDTYSNKRKFIELMASKWLDALDTLDFLEKYDNYDKWRERRAKITNA